MVKIIKGIFIFCKECVENIIGEFCLYISGLRDKYSRNKNMDYVEERRNLAVKRCNERRKLLLKNKDEKCNDEKIPHYVGDDIDNDY